MATRKIKTRKTRLKEYNERVKDIPKHDPIERIMHCLGDKLTEERVKKIIKQKEHILANRTYSCVKLTMYEDPVQSERPRHRSFGGMVMSYVPNAKENKEYIKNFLKKLKQDLDIINTPVYITCKSYHPMPTSGITVEEQVLYEAGILDPVTKPDFDNMIKSYTDMMIEVILLDDDLIYKALIQKFYSFLPRIELCLYYEDSHSSDYVFRKIKGRKSYKRLKDQVKLIKLK